MPRQAGGLATPPGLLPAGRRATPLRAVTAPARVLTLPARSHRASGLRSARHMMRAILASMILRRDPGRSIIRSLPAFIVALCAYAYAYARARLFRR